MGRFGAVREDITKTLQICMATIFENFTIGADACYYHRPNSNESLLGLIPF